MAQKAESENSENPKPENSKSDGARTENTRSASGPKSQQPTGAPQPSSAGPSSRAGPPELRGVRVDKQEKKQYLIATRRAPGVAPLGVMPLALNVVELALRAAPDIEVVDVIGPGAVMGTLADGMAGTPNVIVARMTSGKAELLSHQAQGQLVVEPDQPLALLDIPSTPPLVTASVGGALPLPVTVVVTAKDDSPIEGAEVYLYGSLLPTMGVTNSSGQVTLSLLGDTPRSIRALYVKPKSDYWSFYQQQPNLDPSQPNIVVLRDLSENYPDFPMQQVMGWGQRAMRLDQIPGDRRGQGIKIAIIDSGAATTHEDLRSITRGFDALEKNSHAGNWMVDTIAHGSHCAGVIAGSNENKVGILGFAPAAEVHVCKIFPGGQISHLVDALEYCIEQRVDVVNLSLGTDQISEVLEQQLLRVVTLGIACITAAGNSSGPVQYPASSPNVLAVAAIGKVGEFPTDSYHAQTMQGTSADGYFSPRFTCYGPEIAVCAPGVAVLSSVPPNGFAAWDGTSMAAPHVTGLAALVLAHHPDFAGPFKVRNAQRVQRLFRILKASARPVNLGDPRRTGFGIPDVPTALTLRLDAPVPQQQAQYGTQQQGYYAPQGAYGSSVVSTQGLQPASAELNPFFNTQSFGAQLGSLGGQTGWFMPLSVVQANAPYASYAQQGYAPQIPDNGYGVASWTLGNASIVAPTQRAAVSPAQFSGHRGYWGWWNGG